MKPALLQNVFLITVVLSLNSLRCHSQDDTYHQQAAQTDGSQSSFPHPSGGGGRCHAGFEHKTLAPYAKANILMLITIDHTTWAQFGASFLHNLRGSGVTYAVFAALDARVTAALEAHGESQCVRTPASMVGFDFDAPAEGAASGSRGETPCTALRV